MPRRPHRRRPAAAWALLLVACFGLSGCITQPVNRKVYLDGGIEVFLRSDKRFTTIVEKHYAHPITISAARMAHILSRLDIRRGTEKDRVPAIPTEILYSVAEGVSKALAEATPDEHVVAQSLRKTRKMYLFDRNFLSNFIVYARGDQLYIHLSRSDWPVPPRRKERLPQPEIGDHPMDFKAFPGIGMALVDKQSVVVEWRDPIFREPTRTKISASGEVIRREVLMESPPEDWPENQPALPSDALENLSPESLRALADLEERRRNGLVTESEYRSERGKLLNP
jgi:hypothetical protein